MEIVGYITTTIVAIFLPRMILAVVVGLFFHRSYSFTVLVAVVGLTLDIFFYWLADN